MFFIKTTKRILKLSFFLLLVATAAVVAYCRYAEDEAALGAVFLMVG